MIVPIRRTLYMAGPYTRPDPVINTHAVCRAAMIVFEQTRWVPVVPHLSLLWHAIVPRPIETWYELDIHQMLHCDAVVRMPGASTGADNEMRVALDHGMERIPFKSLPAEAQTVWAEVTG